jgi:hypothetical protein
MGDVILEAAIAVTMLYIHTLLERRIAIPIGRTED